MTETATEQPAVTEAAPFEGLSKAEMMEHLTTVHQVKRISGGSFGYSKLSLGPNSKATKDELIRAHKSSHARNEDPEARPENDESIMIRGYRYARITVPHVHTEFKVPDVPEPTEADKQTAADAGAGRPITRRLTNAEINRVAKVVDLDFKALDQEIRQLAADKLSESLDAVRAEWADRQAAAPEFVAASLKIVTKARKKYQKLQEDARASGIDLGARSTDIGQYFNPTSEVKGYEEARKDTIRQNNEALQRAIIRLERQRAGAQRQIMMAGITDVAQELLDGQPTAKEMMIAAASEQAQIESGRR